MEANYNFFQEGFYLKEKVIKLSTGYPQVINRLSTGYPHFLFYINY